jgi:hypothetical protein
MKKLSEETKKEMIERLKDMLLEGMFGDGIEEDYILDGINFKGLNNMSDEELLEEFSDVFAMYIEDGEGGEFDLYEKAKKELGL